MEGANQYAFGYYPRAFNVPEETERQRNPLDDFLSCYPIHAEVEQDVSIASKAKDYFAALAEFRRNDEEDVFVPMNLDASFQKPAFSMTPMLSARSKTVGSRVVHSKGSNEAVYGSNHGVFNDAFINNFGANTGLFNSNASSAGMLNYASVAKINPLHHHHHHHQPQYTNAFPLIRNVQNMTSANLNQQVLGVRGNFSNRPSSNFPRLDRNNNEAQVSRDGLPVNMSKPPPPSIASSVSGRLRTMNGVTVVNGINLANLKFVKPAPQCFKWDDQSHRQEQPNCRLWHPRELCKYYPKCTLSAEVCGFGHPFCGEYCECDPKKRSLQKNHRVVPLHLQEAKEYMKQNPINRGKTTR